MTAKDTEREILQKAVEGIREAADLDVQILHGDADFDAILQIRQPLPKNIRMNYPADRSSAW